MHFLTFVSLTNAVNAVENLKYFISYEIVRSNKRYQTEESFFHVMFSNC